MNIEDIKTGSQLRDLRLEYGISQQTIIEIIGFTPNEVQCWEADRKTPSKWAIARYVQAVQDCAEGKYPYVPVKRIRRKPTTYSHTRGRTTAAQVEELRTLILRSGLTYPEIAEVVKGTGNYIGHIVIRRQKVAIGDYLKLKNFLLSKQAQTLPAASPAPAQTLPAPAEQAKSQQAQALPATQAKSEHTHYCACTAKQAMFLAEMLRELEIPAHRIADFLGMPREIMAAKLNGEMPVYQPEYSAILRYIKQGVPASAGTRQLTFL